MKKIIFIFIIQLLIQKQLYSQTYINAPSLVLQGDVGFWTPMGVSYNPNKNLYYFTTGGSTLAPFFTFNNIGNQVDVRSLNFDHRGIWWNINTNQLEGNGFHTEGLGRYPLDGSGIPNSNVNVFLSFTTPGMQSMGVFNPTSNEILFWNGSSLLKYDYTTGINKGSISINIPASSVFTQNSMGYTGIIGSELVFYDYENKRVYIYNISGGNYVKYNQLPTDAPANNPWGDSFANGYIFLYDYSNKKNLGYKLNLTLAPTFANPGPITLCTNGSYYLNPSTTNGTFSSSVPSVATVNSSGYVTGIAIGTTEVSLTNDGGTVTASVTVGSTSSVTISDNTALPNYKFISNTPQGPVDGTINYVGYKGFTYSSQTRPTNTGYYRASKQVSNEAGCAVPFYIIKCDACDIILPVLTIGQTYQGGIVFYVSDGGTHGLIVIRSRLATSRPANMATWAEAQPLVDTYNSSGGLYNDWRLPTKSEIELISSNLLQSQSNLDGWFWSSTEFDAGNVYIQWIPSGILKPWDKLDNNNLGVLAIRAF